MKNKNYMLQELREIAPIMAQISNADVYSVSPGYFSNLSEEIIKRLKLYKEYADNLPSSTPYSIPEDYFANLSGLVLQKVLTYQQSPNGVVEEMETIAPLLNAINKKPVYSVPPGFFDKIEIPYTQVKKQKTKTVSIRWSRFLRLSVAAAVTSILAIGVYTITGNNFTTSRNRNAKNVVKSLSKEEIVNFLKTTSSENVTSATKHENAVKGSLKNISDKEIHQFLKETGESDEI